jgi:hypothetical protein
LTPLIQTNGAAAEQALVFHQNYSTFQHQPLQNLQNIFKEDLFGAKSQEAAMQQMQLQTTQYATDMQGILASPHSTITNEEQCYEEGSFDFIRQQVFTYQSHP